MWGRPGSSESESMVNIDWDPGKIQTPHWCRFRTAEPQTSTPLAKKKLPLIISGFSVIPLLYKSSVTHYLHARLHSSKSDSSKFFPMDGRPSSLWRNRTQTCAVFQKSGTVEKVLFDLTSRSIATMRLSLWRRHDTEIPVVIPHLSHL